MKVLIDEDLYPDLYAKLSEARHSRARAELLRRLASTCLKLESGQQLPNNQRNTTQANALPPVSGTGLAQTTKTTIGHSAPAATHSTSRAAGLSLPANATNAVVAGMGKYLA